LKKLNIKKPNKQTPKKGKKMNEVMIENSKSAIRGLLLNQ